jgi:hypothetical protein
MYNYTQNEFLNRNSASKNRFCIRSNRETGARRVKMAPHVNELRKSPPERLKLYLQFDINLFYDTNAINHLPNITFQYQYFNY